MRAHSANELQFQADIIAADSTTVLASGVRNGLEDLGGARLEEAQLVSAESTHMVLFRTQDATALTRSCYVRCNGLLYIVDYTRDPRKPRPGIWLEVYCHIGRP